MINTENDKEVHATSGKAWLYSQIFNPITATRRQLMDDEDNCVYNLRDGNAN